jgi:hypothetical protein
VKILFWVFAFWLLGNTLIIIWETIKLLRVKWRSRRDAKREAEHAAWLAAGGKYIVSALVGHPDGTTSTIDLNNQEKNHE